MCNNELWLWFSKKNDHGRLRPSILFRAGLYNSATFWVGWRPASGSAETTNQAIH